MPFTGSYIRTQRRTQQYSSRVIFLLSHRRRGRQDARRPQLRYRDKRAVFPVLDTAMRAKGNSRQSRRARGAQPSREPRIGAVVVEVFRLHDIIPPPSALHRSISAHGRPPKDSTIRDTQLLRASQASTRFLHSADTQPGPQSAVRVVAATSTEHVSACIPEAIINCSP